MGGSFFVLILVMLLVLWLFMIRPQRRRQQSQQAMIDNLRVGDEIMTAGGFYGTVSRIFEDEIAIELSPGVDVRLAKRAIATVVSPEAPEGDDPYAGRSADGEEQVRR